MGIVKSPHRATSHNICLTPNLEAYSNDPHKNGVLQSSLFYLTLDAANCQSEKWKEQHPAPHQMEEDFEGLDHYQTTVGGLLKYVCGHVCDLLLTNVLETVKIKIKGNIPHRKELLAIRGVQS
ncbi:hypothetical protein PSTT_11608 [Puccinia striiformis]|uniref:Uncharacterized protein n=2 Tax=Puccinia striiformis TaxID=27350 RepID=A0A0L0V3W0_9BASI|nr:hypothetical protein PSTG_12647 [Puccinia striiformis f. sp. tritici PST-78]POW02742.1 hypothetical protein PSTT_11608 [Puccinia striiformis]